MTITEDEVRSIIQARRTTIKELLATLKTKLKQAENKHKLMKIVQAIATVDKGYLLLKQDG